MAAKKKEKKPSPRTDAKTEVQRIAGLFSPLIHKPVTFSFGKFSFNDVVIQEIKLAGVSKMKNAPEKRKNGEDKLATPHVMQMDTNAGILYFVLEDIEVVAITNGMIIITAANEINFRG